MERFNAYMKERKAAMAAPPVGYFCMEYGLHECLPLYSGGLGVLAGDHLKAASDLKVPLVAVGLAWRNGYFVQRLDHQGNQVEESREISSRADLAQSVLAEDGSRVHHLRALPGALSRNPGLEGPGRRRGALPSGYRYSNQPRG